MGNYKGKKYPKGFFYIKDRKCLTCGGLIKPFNISADRKYCSNLCRQKVPLLINNRKCKICNKILKPFQPKKNKLYCSKKCQLNRDGDINNKWKTEKCLNCNKKFTSLISKNRKFCSKECLYDYETFDACRVCGGVRGYPRPTAMRLCKECYIAHGTLKLVLFKKKCKGITKFLNKNNDLVLSYMIFQKIKKETRNELTNYSERNKITGLARSSKIIS